MASYYLRERQILGFASHHGLVLPFLHCWTLDLEALSSESVTDVAQQRLQLWQVLLYPFNPYSSYHHWEHRKKQAQKIQ